MSAPPSPATLVALAGFLTLYAAERLFELALSARHARRLVARGAVEHGGGHFPWIVAFHTALPVALTVEVLWGGARPNATWPAWLLVLGVAQLLRFAAIRALGDYWCARVLVVPGMTRVRSGPYRALRHPNYLAVALEVLAAPLLFGAWRTTIAATVINAILLGIRIRVEERALGVAVGPREAAAGRR